MSELQKNQLIIFAGPNGSGKSTLYAKLYKRNASLKEAAYINPDDIKKQHQTTDINAGKIAINNMRELMDKKKSYVRESTFSQNFNTIAKDVDNAKKQGYESTLIFVGLNDPNDNIARVGNRAKEGGHDIPADIIKRRWAKSMANLEKAVPIFDNVLIYDNSGKNSKLIAKYEQGKIIGVYNKKPDWVQKIDAINKDITIYSAKENLRADNSAENKTAIVKELLDNNIKPKDIDALQPKKNNNKVNEGWER